MIQNEVDLQRNPRERVRPIEAVPSVLSDFAVVRALRTHYVRRELSAEQVRAAKLVALIAFSRLGETRFGTSAAPWSVELPLQVGDIARTAGLRGAQVDEALANLREAGVLEEIRGDGVRYRLASDAFESSPAADLLDWPAVVARLAGEAAALLVFRAFVDVLPAPLDRWGPVRLADLEEHTGYGSVTVRRGKQTLVDTGILEEDMQAGQQSRYRFSALARGLASPPVVGLPSSPRSDPQPVLPDVAPSQSAAPANPVAPAGEAVLVQVGGISVHVPRGATLRIEFDPSGRQIVRIGEHVVIGPV